MTYECQMCSKTFYSDPKSLEYHNCSSLKNDLKAIRKEIAMKNKTKRNLKKSGGWNNAAKISAPAARAYAGGWKGVAENFNKWKLPVDDINVTITDTDREFIERLIRESEIEALKRKNKNKKKNDYDWNIEDYVESESWPKNKTEKSTKKKTKNKKKKKSSTKKTDKKKTDEKDRFKLIEFEPIKPEDAKTETVKALKATKNN